MIQKEEEEEEEEEIQKVQTEVHNLFTPTILFNILFNTLFNIFFYTKIEKSQINNK